MAYFHIKGCIWCVFLHVVAMAAVPEENPGPAAPYYFNDFEQPQQCDLQFWVSSGQIQTEFLGLTDEPRVSGNKSLKLVFRVTKKGHYYYFKVPIHVPWKDGSTYVVDGHIRVEGPKDVRVKFGINRTTVLGAQDVSGCYPITEGVERQGEWTHLVSQELGRETGDDIRLRGVTPQARVWFDAIYLDVSGAGENDLVTVYLDDLVFRPATPEDQQRWREDKEKLRPEYAVTDYPDLERTFAWGVCGSLEARTRFLDLPLKVGALLTARDWKEDFYSMSIRLGGQVFAGRPSSQDDRLAEFLDLNAAHGFAVVPSIFLSGYYEPNVPREQCDQAIDRVATRFRNHPALLAWYIIDEPRPDSIVLRDHWIRPRNRIAALDDRHPVLGAFNSPASVRYFARHSTVTCIDWYPIWRNLTPGLGHPMCVGAMCQLAWDNGARKIWFIPQAYGDAIKRRIPTAAELRLMTYLPLATGATGIIYYVHQASPAWDPGGGSPAITDIVFARPHEMGQEVRRLGRIIPMIGPVLLSSRWTPTSGVKVEATDLPLYGMPSVQAHLHRSPEYDVLVVCNLDVEHGREARIRLPQQFLSGRRLYDLHGLAGIKLSPEGSWSISMEPGDGHFYLLATPAVATQVFQQIQRRHYNALKRLFSSEWEEARLAGIDLSPARSHFQRAAESIHAGKIPSALDSLQRARGALEQGLRQNGDYAACRQRITALQSLISKSSWEFEQHAMAIPDSEQRRVELAGPLRPAVDQMIGLCRAYYRLRYGLMTGQMKKCLTILPSVEEFAASTQQVVQAVVEKKPMPSEPALPEKLAKLNEITKVMEAIP